MTGPRRGRAAVAAAIVGGLTTGSAYAVEAATAGGDVLGPGVVQVDVGIHHSRFTLGTLRVREGSLVEFTVRNDDPIGHELVVGDDAVHRAHEEGTEPRHPPRPGEVSVGPGADAMTFYTFDEPGTYQYACHLPGHVAFGMVGEIQVLPAD
ncbi:MAG TPA: plastocyanin/azurin family copper-binding protein [Acidimicrobiales bacterium]|nr:plastocyanin/azurin family copper-binding protein [Acidimicrobiales bacterium]